MNFYIISWVNLNEEYPIPEIAKVAARSYNEAKDKSLKAVLEDSYPDFDYDNTEDWDDICDRVYDKYQYSISDIKDLELLKYIDILIDGKFEQDKKVDFRTTKNNDDKYRGSSNQRVIDVQKTLESYAKYNKVTLLDGET